MNGEGWVEGAASPFSLQRVPEVYAESRILAMPERSAWRLTHQAGVSPLEAP